MNAKSWAGVGVEEHNTKGATMEPTFQRTEQPVVTEDTQTLIEELP